MTIPPEEVEGLRTIAAEIKESLAELESLTKELTHRFSPLRSRKPRALTLRGLASYLHDFYTGCEEIFLRIARDLNNQVPTDMDWHTRLLHQMTLDVPGVRPALLNRKTEEKLRDYLGFRHVFRHLYGRNLDWVKLRRLCRAQPPAFRALARDIRQFLKTIERL